MTEHQTHSNLSFPTAATALLGMRYPIINAPMAGVAGGALAAAVSNAGGFGLIGGGYCDEAWIEQQFAEARGARVGVGFITWRLRENPAALDTALKLNPAAVLLSFDDPTPWVTQIRDADALVIAQVQSVRQAERAAQAGVDLIIAQGGEAGGHGGMRATLPLVPAVIDAVGALPVIASGGIADGRGILAAFALGASGVMMGSRFYVANEALAGSRSKAAALNACGDDTVRSDIFDQLRGWKWPPGYQLRTLSNETTQNGLSATSVQRFERAINDDDTTVAPVIVGEAVDLVDGGAPAQEIVHALMSQLGHSIDELYKVMRNADP